MPNEDELSHLREIRDSTLRHEKYVMERDKPLHEQLMADSERIKRQVKAQVYGQIILIALTIGVWVVAMVQMLKFFQSTH